jgi:nucleoside-diphosphate-sugar epimerase
MKYCVTGATGFIGGRVARQLVAAGHEVIAIARSPGRAGDLTEAGIEVVGGDIVDKASLRAPMTGVDGVFHIAGWYKTGVRDNRDGWTINVDGTRNVLETMRDLEIPRGVYTSTLAVNGDTGGRIVDDTYYQGGPWLSEYDRTKWVAHYEVADPMMQAGLPLTIVLPGLVYGPGDTSQLHDTWQLFLQGRLPVAPAKTAYSWAHVDDIAHAHILAMEKGRSGQEYIIAGPTHTLIEAITIASQLTGVPPPRLRPAPGLMKAMAATMGVLDRVLPLPPSYTGEGLRIVAGVTYTGSTAKARRELGYDPRPLTEGLRETLAWEQEQLSRRS